MASVAPDPSEGRNQRLNHGKPPLDPINFALRANQRVASRGDCDLRRVQPAEEGIPDADLYVSFKSPPSRELCEQLQDLIARDTGWCVRVHPYADESPSSAETITGATVIESSDPWIESPPIQPPEILEAEVVDTGQVPSNIVVRGQVEARFGLVRVADGVQAIRSLVSGDTTQMAGRMMHDKVLKDALAGTPAFNDDVKGVEEAIRKLQIARPVGDAVAAAGVLAWAVQDLWRSQEDPAHLGEAAQHLLSVAYMILGAAAKNGNNPELLATYIELVAGIDRPLAKSLEELSSENATTARDAFQTIFAKLVKISGAVRSPTKPAAGGTGEHQAEGETLSMEHLLVGSLVLRHLTIVFQDPKKQSLHREIAERFAQEAHHEIVEAQGAQRSFLGLMACCHEVAFDFFLTLLRHVVAETDGPIAADAKPFGREPAGMRGDAVECLLACGCIGWPQKFYNELAQRYDHSSPRLQLQFLQAMKFAVGEDKDRKGQMVSRCLALVQDERPEYKNVVRAQAASLLHFFSGALAEHLNADELKAYRLLSADQRKYLLQEVLVPACDYAARFPNGRAQVLPLVMHEIHEGNVDVINGNVLNKLLTNDFLDTLPHESAREIWRAIYRHYANFRGQKEREQVRRIVKHCGFPAIRDAFDSAQELAMINPPQSRELLLLGAEVAAGYKPATPKEKGEIQKFILNVITPRFLRASRTKFEAMSGSSAVEDEKTDNLHKLNKLKGEIDRGQRIATMITSHPGFAKKEERIAAIDAQLDRLNLDPKKEVQKIKELRAEKEAVLGETLRKLQTTPFWNDKLAALTIKQMRGIIREVETWREEAGRLETELSSLTGGKECYVSLDGNERFNTLDEARAAEAKGTRVRWQREAGKAETAKDEILHQVELVAAEARIFRLFLRSPALDHAAAQEIFDLLNPGESQAVLCRFSLSLDHPHVGPGCEPEAEEGEEGAGDVFRQCILDSTEIDIGQEEEITAAAPYDAEGELTAVLDNIVKSDAHRDDVEHFLEAVQEMVDQGRMVLSPPEKHPLMLSIWKQVDTGIKAKFQLRDENGWSPEANAIVLDILSVQCRKMPPEMTESLDRGLRQVMQVWLRNWNPPRDLPGLPTVAILGTLGEYIPHASSFKRKAELVYLLARLANDRYASLPHSGVGPKVLEVLQTMRGNLTEQERRCKVAIEKGKPEERLGIVLDGAISALEGRFSRHLGGGAGLQQKPTLSLPFEATGHWAGLALPQLPPESPSA